MTRDILIDQIREVRHAISARYGHDPHALIEHYREYQKRFANRLLPEEPEPVAASHDTDNRER